MNLSHLEDELSKLNFKLEGQYPLLKASFYTILLSPSNATIYYGNQQEKLGTIKPIPYLLAGKLNQYNKKITNRRFCDDEFIQKLYQAYINSEVKPAPLHTIYTNLSIPDYTRVFFSYDLYRLNTRRLFNHELSLITATRAYTTRKKDYLWIPSKNSTFDGYYISHLSFKDVTY